MNKELSNLAEIWRIWGKYTRIASYIIIDEARETNDQEERTELYEEAMEYILDLAIELPVYQRSVLYAYNSKVIDKASVPEDINPYSSPLDRIWEIEFAD